MKHRIVVEFDAPEADKGTVLAFVDTAIRSEVGHCAPDDPMHYLDRSSIRVTSARKEPVS